MFTLICLILVIIGAINWFSVGVFQFNIVEWITMNNMIAYDIIYGIVGVAGIWLIVYLCYNKFSPKKLGAPECMTGKSKNDNSNK